MNYLKHYLALIRKAGCRETPTGYTEKHHIFPVSVYGNNDRIVALTAKEHFIAHLLLWKGFNRRYGKRNHKTVMMMLAAWGMRYGQLNRGNHQRYSSRTVSKLREAYAERIRGDNNPAKREEVRKKIRDSKLGKERPDMKGKAYFGASPERIKAGTKKMQDKKTGMKINYPKNRKSPPCSIEKAKRISEVRKQTLKKYAKMSKEEFRIWVSSFNLYDKNGRRNKNIVNAINARGDNINKYYGAD